MNILFSAFKILIHSGAPSKSSKLPICEKSIDSVKLNLLYIVEYYELGFFALNKLKICILYIRVAVSS